MVFQNEEIDEIAIVDKRGNLIASVSDDGVVANKSFQILYGKNKGDLQWRAFGTDEKTKKIRVYQRKERMNLNGV